MNAIVDIDLLHSTFASTLVPFGNQFREAESKLAQLEDWPEFVTKLLTLVREPSIDLGIRRAGAVYLKNKIIRSWSPRAANPISDADKSVFRREVVSALIGLQPALAEFLLVCVSTILSYDYQIGQWPELVPQIKLQLQSPENLDGISAGLGLLKQVCRFHRWNPSEVNKKLAPILAELFPAVLDIAEAAVTQIQMSLALGREEQLQIQSQQSIYYGFVYDSLKVYKLSTSRFMPPILREPSITERTSMLFANVIMMRWPEYVINIDDEIDRVGSIPAKCLKWATANIARIHNTYLTASYSHMSENAAQYAPWREMILNTVAPEITRLLVQRLKQWSLTKSTSLDPSNEEIARTASWLSDRVLYYIVTYLEAMIDVKAIFTSQIEPELTGLFDHVLFPLLGPNEGEFESFEDDPIEFIQRRADYHDSLFTPKYASSGFIRKVARKRKDQLPNVVQFLERKASSLGSLTAEASLSAQQVHDRVCLFNLVQALAPTFLAKSSPLNNQLEPFISLYATPALSNSNAYLRAEACDMINVFSSVKYNSRELVQQLFQGIMQCFFDQDHLAVQVAAAKALKSLSMERHNVDVSSALSEHITEVIRNLLLMTERIDLDSLLSVLDHFVEQFPEQITPFAVELAAQLTRQFIALASELAEAQRQLEEAGNETIGAATELMIANDEKTSAGLSIISSLTNLQNSLDSQRELVAKLDEAIAPVVDSVYRNELTEFYPDVLSLHENSLFVLKFVPAFHWQFFDMLIDLLGKTALDYFEEAIPVLENFIMYGATELAEMPERLQSLKKLLVSLYAVEPTNAAVFDFGDSTAFAEALKRLYVMGFLTKLLTCQELFQSPFTTFVPQIVETILARVKHDSEQKHSFPARYNVTTTSVLLGALFHDTGNTLTLLSQAQALGSFMQTWLQSLPNFNRVNDLKLSLVAILALLDYQATNPSSEIPQSADLVEALSYTLEALPGAAAKAAEIIKQEQEDTNDDEEDFDEFGEDGLDEDFNNLESAELNLEVDGLGAGTFMYENPGGARGGSDAPSTSNVTRDTEEAGEGNIDAATLAELRGTLLSEIGFETDDIDGDIYSAAPLDLLNPYDALRAFVQRLQSGDQLFHQKFIGSMSEKNKVIVEESLQRPELLNYKFVN